MHLSAAFSSERVVSGLVSVRVFTYTYIVIPCLWVHVKVLYTCTCIIFMYITCHLQELKNVLAHMNDDTESISKPLFVLYNEHKASQFF